jgi:hypothetical protein
VFLNHQAAAWYQALASIILGPLLREKWIYRAAVWQRLRTTETEDFATLAKKKRNGQTHCWVMTP